jgi:MFS family permease
VSISSVVADITPLREHRDFRRLFVGSTVQQIGTQFTAVAVPVQVYDITHSAFATGMIGAVAVVPLIVFGLYGGSVADAVDRRRLALMASTALMLLSVVLVVQASAGWNQVWLLYLIVAMQAGLFSVNSPARGAMVPRIVPAHQLPAANSLFQIGFNTGFTVGPLLAGVMIGAFGFKAAYAVDVAMFVIAITTIRGLPPMPPQGKASPAGWRSVVEGLSFLKSRHNVLMTFLLDLAAMIFGSPRALFPAIAVAFYGGGPRTVGLLFAAPAIGAVVGAAFGGWLPRVHRQGLAVIWSIVVWALAIVGFGLVHVLWVGVIFLGIAGAADMVSAVYRSTILQVATPDEMRGRLQGVFTVVVTGGPRLGDVRSGSFAPIGLGFSLVSGGALCLVFVALLVARFPGFARYDARHPVA